MFQNFFDFIFHVFGMGPLPINPAATTTKGKTCGVFIDKRGDKIPGGLPGDLRESDIAFQTASVGRDLAPEVKPVKDLPDLLLPFLTGHKECLQASGFLDEGRIASEQSSALFLSDGQKLVIIDPGEKEGVKAQDLEPSGQFPEHAIDGEFHALRALPCP